MEWYVGVLKQYAVFTGRARRKEFWMFYLINLLIGFAIIIVENAIGLSQDGQSGPIYGLYSLAVLLPFIGVGIRRMHDAGHSGWWLLLPIVNLVFLVQDSQPGENKYGPNPKEVGMPYAPTAPSAYAPSAPAYPAAPPSPVAPMAPPAPPMPVAAEAPAPAMPPVAAPPAPAAPAAAPGAGAAWMADPSGRHEYRYWDGSQWTENVSDAGVAAVDPL